MQKFAVSCLLLLCALAAIQCSGDEEPVSPNGFSGKWKISQVVYDGIVQPDWEGIDFNFSQLSAESGYYTIPKTPYDSIWTSSGNWRKTSQPDAFYREDDIEVSYFIDADGKKMTLNLYLPWTKQSVCDEEGVCLDIVTGHWIFELKR